MTSNNQVSPVIRISRGERDASARATHLKAASKKYLETTIERKQMSTTTNFKRIALVAVAALGLGVLSSVPTTAAINADSVTLSSATATQSTAETYTATSAVVTVSFFGAGAATANATTGDSMSITAALTGAPAGNVSLPTLRLVETSSAMVDSTTTKWGLVGDTVSANVATVIHARSSSVVTTAKFAVYLTGPGNGLTGTPTVAGAYTVKITPAAINGGTLQGSTAQTLTITVVESPALVKTASSAKAYIQKAAASPAILVAGITTDSVVAVSKSNATATMAAQIAISQLNAAGFASSDSLTVEISGAGTLGSGTGTATARGRNLTVKVDDTVTVWSDGNAGVGTITIKSATSSALLATKTVTFTDVFSKFAKETAAVAILGTSAKNAVTFVMQDSVSNTLSTNGDVTLTAFSSDATIATAGAVTYSNDSGTVSVTGVKAGTVTITVGNGTTLALSTIKSAPVTVRVGSTSIASVKVSFDKASYSIGEKALITVTPLDSLGLPTVPSALANTFAATKALKEDKLFSQNALLVDSTTVTFADATSATAGTTAGSATYTVYMPLTSGTVKVTGTLGAAAALATAIQGTEVTASATVTDSGSAALAAVTALATTVASLRTLIVTLTNLVLKIQKKVKA
jgi:hypothetical protein